MDRVKEKFRKLKEKDEGALICYLPIIDADPASTVELADIFFEEGVDLVELSITSVKPWLDGRTIQMLHLSSLANHATADTSFTVAKILRSRHPDWPIIPMTDYSGVINYGVDRFIENCALAETDAVEIPDYPLFASNDPHLLQSRLRRGNIGFVSFCNGLSQAGEESPEYPLFCKIVRETSCFLFLMSTLGITGKRKDLAGEYLKIAVKNVRKTQAKEQNNFPVAVGFGISTPEHVAGVIRKVGADGAVVGSAISDMILKKSSQREVAAFIRSLKKATKKQPLRGTD